MSTKTRRRRVRKHRRQFRQFLRSGKKPARHKSLKGRTGHVFSAYLKSIKAEQ